VESALPLWTPPKPRLWTPGASPWWRIPASWRTATRAEVAAAIGTPALVADSTGNASETTSSTTCTTGNSAGAIAAGDLVVILATARVAATLTVASVTASAGGLTYTTEIDCGPVSASNGGAAVIYALNPSGVASGTNWTVTWSASATRKAVSVYSVRGLATTSPADSPLWNAVTPGTNPASSTSNEIVTADAASAQADEIFFNVCKQSNSVSGVTGSPSAGWTELQDRVVGASTFMHHYAAYRIVSAVETPTITVTFTTTGTNWIGGIAGFKMAAATAKGIPVNRSRRAMRPLIVR
jgi:hypothetical protein